VPGLGVDTRVQSVPVPGLGQGVVAAGAGAFARRANGHATVRAGARDPGKPGVWEARVRGDKTGPARSVPQIRLATHSHTVRRARTGGGAQSIAWRHRRTDEPPPGPGAGRSGKEDRLSERSNHCEKEDEDKNSDQGLPRRDPQPVVVPCPLVCKGISGHYVAISVPCTPASFGSHIHRGTTIGLAMNRAEVNKYERARRRVR
jgi:hypothetical protein